MAEWLCAICGGVFAATPSSKTVTCSKECSSIHRSRMHVGKRNEWGDTSKARTAAERTGNLRKGTLAALASAKAGPFETNINAKVWQVVGPDGRRYKVRNLRLWCETHADLFEPYPWGNAYAGLRQVAAWLAGTRRHQVSQWRGWTLRDVPQRA